MLRNLTARLQTLFVLIGLVLLFGIASPHFLSTDDAPLREPARTRDLSTASSALARTSHRVP